MNCSEIIYHTFTLFYGRSELRLNRYKKQIGKIVDIIGKKEYILLYIT